jgi:hypothetical protein
MLLKCTNSYYVNPTDKKTLVEESSPMERNHLRYLLMKDPEIVHLMRNHNLFMHPFLYAFGLFGHNID